MAAETIVLDDSAVATDRTALDISSFVGGDGIDWGDAEIVAYMAEAERGQTPVDFRIPNRTVVIPLTLKTVGATTFATIRTSVQAKAALFQREGGWLKRVLSDGTSTYYLDIVNATLKLSGGWMQAHRDADIDAVLTLEAIPDFYGAEISLADHTETTLPHVVFADTAIKGDYPARVRLVVDEDDGDDQMFLMFGVQSKNYSSSANAALFYEAEGRTPLGGAATAAGITGSSGAGSNVMRQGTLTSTYQAMLSTQAVSAGAHLSHIGTFRVWARTHRPATNTGEVSIALEWGEGDFRKRTVNDPVVYPVDDREGAYCLTNLGLVSLARVATGTQRWEGRIISKSTVTDDDLDVDCLWLMPADEGYGEVRGVAQFENPTSFSARDEFTHAGGSALTGRTLPVGGTWAGAGDAGDFALEDDLLNRATRDAISDADEYTGRYAIAGSTNYTNTLVQVEHSSPNGDSNKTGVLARYTDTSNWLRALLEVNPVAPFGWRVRVVKNLAGTKTQLGSYPISSGGIVPGAVYSTRLVVDALGRFYVWFWPAAQSLPALPVLSGCDSDLASGTLASGKPGIYDYNGSTDATFRGFDNFFAAVPTLDAAMFASQSCEIRHDRVIREDSAGAIWTPVSDPRGDYLRLPPAGLENRSTRIIVKGSRNDPDTGTDTGVDDISARAHYRPSYLTVPGT